MLVLKQELDLQGFEREFRDELKDLSFDGIEIVFDSLCDVMAGGDYSVMQVRDYLRFQMRISSLDEVISDYRIDTEDQEDDKLIEIVENYLNYNTYLLGMYEEDEITYFIFDEF